MTPADLQDVCISKILQFVQSLGLLNAKAKGLHKSLITEEVNGSVRHPSICVLFCGAYLLVVVTEGKLQL
jgi:hypothetical protein